MDEDLEVEPFVAHVHKPKLADVGSPVRCLQGPPILSDGTVADDFENHVRRASQFYGAATMGSICHLEPTCVQAGLACESCIRFDGELRRWMNDAHPVKDEETHLG